MKMVLSQYARAFSPCMLVGSAAQIDFYLWDAAVVYYNEAHGKAKSLSFCNLWFVYERGMDVSGTVRRSGVVP